jgi:C4-dicarboxylate-specific signal transduction histidine kinase
MKWEWEVIGKTGFQFFGRMSASISHEIKNALAVMNENVGLLSDLAEMAEKGRPVDPSRLKTQAERLVKQVRRTDGIVKNMNKFAHSVDEFSKRVDLDEVLELVCALSMRPASMRGVTVTLEPPSERIPISTSPFLLENLLWLCLDFAFDAVKDDKAIAVRADIAEGIAKITFSGIKPSSGDRENQFPGEREKAFLVALDAEVFLDEGSGELVLHIATNRIL